MSVFNMLDIKRNSFITELELTPQETAVLKCYAGNDYVDDDYVLDVTGINSCEALKTIVSRIKAKTGLSFDRKVGFGYKLNQILLINY